MEPNVRKIDQSSVDAANLLSKITKHLHGMIYQYRLRPDNTSCMPYVSEQISDIFGYSPEDVKDDASALLALIYARDLNQVIQHIEQSAAQLTPWQFEFRIQLKDGSLRWLFSSASPEREPDGSVLWTGYLKDVTETKLLKEMASMGGLALEAKAGDIPDLLLDLDMQGVCHLVHAHSPDILSAMSDGLIGQKLSDFLPSQGAEAVLEAMQEAEVSGKSQGRKFVIDLLQGKRWFEISAVKKEPSELVPQFVVLIRDITGQKKAEDRLNIDAVAFGAISQGIVLTDAQQNVIAINKAFEKITGYGLDDIYGKNLRVKQGAETSHETIQAIRYAISHRIEYTGEVLNYRKDRSTFWNEVTITPVFDDKHQITNYLGVVRDITERKLSQEKLLATKKALLESKERYVDLYEFAPVGYMSLDDIGMVAEANWKARAILGIKRKELGKARFGHFVQEADKGLWKTQFARLKALTIGEESEFELRLFNEDTQQSFDVKLICIRSSEADSHSMVRITLFDITEMKLADLKLRQKEEYQRSLLDNFPFMVWLKDKDSRFLTVNKAFLRTYGETSLEQVIGRTDLELWSAEVAEQYRKEDRAIMLNREPRTVDEVLETGGKRIWVETYKSPVVVNDKVVGIVGFSRDISNRKRTSNYEQFRSKMLELVVHEQNLQVILDRIIVGIEQLNPAMFCLIALLDEQGQHLHTVSAPSLPKDFIKALEGMKIGMGVGSIGTAAYTRKRVIVEDVMTHPYWDKNRKIAKKSGIGSSWAEPIIGAKGNTLGAFGIYHHEILAPDAYDINLIEQSARLISIAVERSQSASKITHLAYYDDVTGLPNRRFLFEQLKRSTAMNVESGKHSAVIYLDIDQFKTINDSRGHEVGDLLLIEVAARLKTCVHASDTVARVGGDEFVVLLENLSGLSIEAAKQAELVSIKILQLLTKPFNLAKHKHHSSASIGITLFGQQQADMEEVLQQADIAMFQAKKSGRNTFRFFDPQMHANITALVGLETELRNAIRSNQLSLYYQVQVDHLGQPFGAEALIRWLHPTQGVVSPAHFIPLAEETGLIIPIGAWVLDSACAQIQAWQAHATTRELTLSLNISAKQFRQADFVQQVKACIAKYKINPSYLRLELTESLLLENVEETVAYMNALGQVGVQFSLDDFGTGYSSLQYLKRLPLYQLKIDQSFVRDIVTDSHDRTIIRTIIAMAQSMYIGVIAEGVESLEQRELLLTNGCRRYQGYYFGKPMPIDQFNALLLPTAQTL